MGSGAAVAYWFADLFAWRRGASVSVGEWGHLFFLLPHLVLAGWLTAALLLGARHLRHLFDAGDDALRIRLKWVVLAGAVWGLSLGFWLASGTAFMLARELVFQSQAYEHLGWLFVVSRTAGGVTPVGVCLGSGLLVYGMLAKGAIDPSFAIRRTTVYGLLGLLFVFSVTAASSLTEDALRAAVGLPAGVTSAAVAGVVAVILMPVKRRLDALLDQMLPATALAKSPTALATIVFSDIVGFTRLTESDRDTALTLMSLFHKAARRAAGRCHGRLVKTVADQVILEFGRASDAVEAARELHRRFDNEARKQGLEPPLVRSGLHYGRITRSTDGDVFGEVVNLAAKVRRVAEPGHIVLTAAVVDQAPGVRWPLTELGVQVLPDVVAPVECYLMQLADLELSGAVT